jgi:hypothetical protein
MTGTIMTTGTIAGKPFRERCTDAMSGAVAFGWPLLCLWPPIWSALRHRFPFLRCLTTAVASSRQRRFVLRLFLRSQVLAQVLAEGVDRVASVRHWPFPRARRHAPERYGQQYGLAKLATKLSKRNMGGGGDGGIRTLDTPLQAYNGLANRRLQPLGHVSSGGALIEARSTDCKPREAVAAASFHARP